MATYKSAYSGPQIDEAVGRVLSGSTDGSSNRNLLDNWYFVNPVNQRGNTSYSGAGYGIDRWKGANTYGNIAVQSDGLQINSIANAFFAIDQVIENVATNLNGKTVTLSVLTSSGDLATGSATLNLTGTLQSFIQFYFSGNDGIAQVNADTSNVAVRLRVQNNKTVKVAAVKLEVGSVSTLANDAPPNYAEELEICKHYYSAPTDVTATNVKLVNAPIIKVKDGVCYIYIQANSLSETLGTNWVKLFTVPSSVRPPVQVGCNLATYPYRTPLFARLTTGGDFEVYNDQSSIATNTQLNAFLAYPLLEERS